MLLALAALEVVATTAPTAARLVAAALLALVLPGRALVLLASPSYRPLLGLDNAVFSVGLSLAATVGVGLVLDRLDAGLTTAGWCWGLGVVTAVPLLATLVVRPLVGPSGVGSTATPARLRPSTAVALLLAGLIATGAVLAARTGAVERDDGYRLTELWALPQQGDVVRVGVGNHTGRVQTYRLVLRHGSTQVARETLTLAQRQTWQQDFTAPVAGTMPLDVDLYAAGGSAPARTVTVSPPVGTTHG